MIKEKLAKALNEQINKEMFSSYLYLSMASYYQAKNLPGFANWMKIQAQEELSHAMMIFNYINERGGKVELTAVAGPKTAWNTPAEPFKEAYAHEQTVTASINNLVDLAMAEKDHAMYIFLQWFVSEQVEEEANASGICEQLALIGENPQGIFMLDRELATRVFVAPTAGA